MDYKQLILVCELMGMTLSYSRQRQYHSYCVTNGKNKTAIFSTEEYTAIKDMQNYLKEVYPIAYQNSINQLKNKS